MASTSLLFFLLHCGSASTMPVNPTCSEGDITCRLNAFQPLQDAHSLLQTQTDKTKTKVKPATKMSSSDVDPALQLIHAERSLQFLQTDTVDSLNLDRIAPTTIQVLHGEDSEKVQAFLENLLIQNSSRLLASEAFPLPDGTESLTCTQDRCDVNGPADGDALERIQAFKQAADSLDPTTDKVTTHSYETMYGNYLLAYLQQAKDNGKLFEIGLGCDMNYGPGASVALWKKLFPNAVLWEAEYNAPCVKHAEEQGMLQGVHTVTGDQGDEKTVQDWAATVGSKFDAVIDDGGHQNKQIRTSFETLWPHVKPGGLYFIEDLQVGRDKSYWQETDNDPVMADRIKAWVEQLLTKSKRSDLPLPEGVETIFCQAEACMLRKVL
jgi:hypothetical protein